MGTNYYVAENLCECCDRYDEAYHIGKSSGGKCGGRYDISGPNGETKSADGAE